VGVSPTPRPLQPEATGATVEVTIGGILCSSLPMLGAQWRDELQLQLALEFPRFLQRLRTGHML
jgi:hypothetical protein